MIVGCALLALHIVLGYKRPGIAFITAPMAALVLAYTALVAEAPEDIILSPILIVATLVAIAVSGRDRESQQWCHWWAWQLLVALTLLLLLGVALAGFSALGAGFVLPLFFIFGVIMIVASPIIYGMVSRRMMVMQVFSTIGSIMRQNLPLAMALDCAATGLEDATTVVFRKVKAWLVKGYPLAEAVRRGYPQCPSRVLAMLCAGEAIDQLPAALTAIETDLKSSAMERRRLQPVHPFYPVAILAFAFLMVLALTGFVIPTFQSVLKETSGGQLPAATRTLLSLTDASGLSGLPHGRGGAAPSVAETTPDEALSAHLGHRLPEMVSAGDPLV
jgi:hypothetical protein